jgi:probable HAF family extracellular repeat protein
MKPRFFRSMAAAAAVLALCAGPAHSAQRPVITMVEVDISSDALATGLNNSAVIVGIGRVDGTDSPFVTDPGGNFVRGLDGVAVGDVAGVNEAGVIVGNVGALNDDHFGLDMRAFMTNPGGNGVVDLGTLGGTRSQATAVNGLGQVVGWSTTAANKIEHAFITDANGTGMRDIGHLSGICASANAVNDHGRVAGYACTAGERFVHAFVTGKDGNGMIDLGTFGGRNSSALGINAHGVVVGWAETHAGFNHAFRTGRNGQGMVDLDPGEHRSQAFGINGRGHIVGQYLDAVDPTARAFVATTHRAKFTDLNKLVHLPDGAVFMGAMAINDLDQIVAYASDGKTYLLSRVFEALGEGDDTAAQ